MKLSPTFSKISYVAIALMLLSACSKKQDAAPDNIMAFRKDASQAQTLDMTSINSGTVLEDRVSGVDYIVSHDINVLANLTIKPGVTIMFKDGAGLTVGAEGSLTAIGTAGNVVYFTSESGKRGAWKGITILSSSARNVISYCKVEHGGATNANGSGNIIIGTGATPAQAEVSNSEITASGTDGIQMSTGSKVVGFAANNIHTNTAYPVSMNIGEAADLYNTNTFASNGKEFIKVTGSGSALISKVINLRKLSEPFIVSGQVVAGNSFNIAAGNQVSMDDNAEIVIEGVAGNGSFTALGSQTQPISIAPVFGGTGVWNKIRFHSSNSSNNIIQYCTISGGGQVNGDGMITVNNDSGSSSDIIIRNCTITNSAASGIYIQNTGTQYNADITTSNTFSNNAKGNVQIK